MTTIHSSTWTNKDTILIEIVNHKVFIFVLFFFWKKIEEGDLVAEGVIDDRIEKKCWGK